MHANQVILLLMAISFFFVLLVAAITILIVIHNQRLNRLYFQKQQVISDSKRKSLAESERMMKQISREVHDTIGHAASFSRVSINKLKVIVANTEALQLLEELTVQNDEILRQSISISHSINHNYIKTKDLHSLLGEGLEYLRLNKSIGCDMSITGNVGVLMPENKLLVYRIAQQALSNILKHSLATEIAIHLQYGDNSFNMSITDNGVGFTPEQLHVCSGIGITNMRERAELIDGEIIVMSSPGNGCSITLLVPKIQFMEAI